jgi:predicted dehydrogenase
MRGRDHAINFLHNKDRFELLAVCDMYDGILARVGDELTAAPYNGTFRRYTNPEVMLAECKPDIFCFATQPTIRLPIIKLGIAAGAKLIAYEKPMANSLQEAAEIDRITREAGVKTTNAHIHRYGKHWQAMKAAIDSGEIGKIEAMEASSVGWYLAYVTHLVDYLIWFNGDKRIVRVHGHASGVGRLDDKGHPSPDYVLGRLEFENGILATVECGQRAPSLLDGVDLSFWLDAGVTVRGSEGWAQVCTGTGWRGVSQKSKEPLGFKYAFAQTDDGDQYVAEMARWLDDDKIFKHPCNGDNVFHGFQVAMGILLSAIEHRTVELPYQYDGEPIIERLKKTLSLKT